MKIGVLAMQGAFIEHEKILKSFDIETVQVRKEEDLKDIDGLIIPGGESTTIGKMIKRYNLLEPIRSKCREGLPVFGTCAGMILLSSRAEGGIKDQPLIKVLNVVTNRNAFGRQQESFEKDISIPDIGGKPFKGVFIRAPIIKETNNSVKVLGKLENSIVAVRENNILATSFHPELTSDNRVHKYFIDMIKEANKSNG